MNKSPRQISNRFIAMLVIAFGIGVLVVLILSVFPISRQLHGNQLALFRFRYELQNWKTANTNSFIFYNLPNDDKRWAAVSLGFILDGWVKTNFVWRENKSEREIMIVCGKEFDDAPKPAIWNYYRRNPAHAVGYSDGTTGLISPEQFSNLNLNGFVSLSSLTANTNASISKP